MSAAKSAPIVANPTAQDFADAINSFKQFGEAIVAGQPKRRITVGELVERTAFNPSGAKRTLPAVVYQNGVKLDEKTLHDGEIVLLDQLKVGRFFGGLVKVRRDPTAVDKTFFIEYDNRTGDQRMSLMNHFRSFEELLQKLTTMAPDVDD